MSKLHPFLTLALLAAPSYGHAAPDKKVVSSSVRAEVKDAIPAAAPKQPKAADYPGPNRLNISAAQFCGDGDVAHYAKSHPTWIWSNDATIQVVLGYWVMPAGKSAVPTKDNFTSLGVLQNLAVNGGYGHKFTTSYGDANVDMLSRASQSLVDLADGAGYRMGTGTTDADKFRVYAGVMMCKTVTDEKPVANLDPALLSNGLKDFIAKIESPALSAAGKANFAEAAGALGVSIDTAAKGKLNFSLGSGGDVKISDAEDNLTKLARQVFEFAEPAEDPANPDAFRTAVRGAPFQGELRALANDLTDKEACDEVGHGVVNTKKFSFEPFPLQMICGALERGQRGRLKTAVKELYDASKPSEFKAARKNVLVHLFTGAVMQKTELAMESRVGSSLKLPRQRCFDGVPDIDAVMSSVVLQIPRRSTMKSNYTVVHPEMFFAIGEDAPYRAHGDAGPMYTVFGMSGADADQYGLDFQRGSALESTEFFSDTMNVNLGVRGVGCSNGPTTCKNEHAPKAEPRG